MLLGNHLFDIVGKSEAKLVDDVVVVIVYRRVVYLYWLALVAAQYFHVNKTLLLGMRYGKRVVGYSVRLLLQYDGSAKRIASVDNTALLLYKVFSLSVENLFYVYVAYNTLHSNKYKHATGN